MKEFCDGKVAEVRCAVLYEKPRSTVRCEYVWRRTDRWIDFPWSAETPVSEAARRRPLRQSAPVGIVGPSPRAPPISEERAHDQEEARAGRVCS